MGVYIQSMEMPESCTACPINTWWDDCIQCKAGKEQFFIDWSENPANSRHPKCPLKAVPTPHGRLIDADAATKLSKARTGKRLLAIDTAPTVIEKED